MKKTARQIAYEVLSKVADSSMLPTTVGKPTYAKPQQGAAVGSLRGAGKAPMGGALAGDAPKREWVPGESGRENMGAKKKPSMDFTQNKPAGGGVATAFNRTHPASTPASTPSEQQVALNPKKR